MIKYFFIGLVSALPFTISFGPVFFAITETSLKRGFKSGAVVSIGILLSDVIYVTLIGLGFSAFFNDDYSQSVFSLFGGCMLFAIGINFLKKQIQLIPSERIVVGKRPVESFLKGFVINSLNPYVALFWTGVVALVNSELKITGNVFISYFSGFLLVLFMSDLGKAWLAQLLRNRLNEKLKIIYRVIGIIFILFGARLFIESLSYFLN